MRLLMISGDRMVSSGKKGAFWYTLEELSKHWERIDVVCPRLMGNGQWTADNGFANVFFHPSSSGLLFQAGWITRKGTELIAEYQHDVMTVHEYPPFYNGIGARRLSQKTGVPHVLEVHHVVGYPKPASLTERIGLFLSKLYFPRAIRAAAAVRTVNKATKQLLMSYGADGATIEVVPSFYLDAGVLRPDPSVQKNYDLVFCARLVANKGLSNVLNAVAGLPDVKLLVIGDGPERSAAEGLCATLGIRDRVTFTGWLPDQQAVVQALQSAKIFVMNSLSEGGPRIALEAMACGLPVICTRVGVMPEVIVDEMNGVFTSGTPEDLREKISSVLGDSALQKKMGKEAERVIDRFERKKLILAYSEFLKRCARKP